MFFRNLRVRWKDRNRCCQRTRIALHRQRRSSSRTSTQMETMVRRDSAFFNCIKYFEKEMKNIHNKTINGLLLLWRNCWVEMINLKAQIHGLCAWNIDYKILISKSTVWITEFIGNNKTNLNTKNLVPNCYNIN